MIKRLAKGALRRMGYVLVNAPVNNDNFPTDFEPEFKPARLGEVARSCLDVTRAREELGFEAQVGLVDGLRRTLESTPA